MINPALVYSLLASAAIRRDFVTMRAVLDAHGIHAVTREAVEQHRKRINEVLVSLYQMDVRAKRLPICALFVLQNGHKSGTGFRRLEENEFGCKFTDEEWDKHWNGLVSEIYESYSLETSS